MKSTLLLLGIILTASVPAFSQTGRAGEPDIQRRLEMIEHGQADVVKSELPTLMTNFQNNPGVLYLQAILTTDGTEATRASGQTMRCTSSINITTRSASIRPGIKNFSSCGGSTRSRPMQ